MFPTRTINEIKQKQNNKSLQFRPLRHQCPLYFKICTGAVDDHIAHLTVRLQGANLHYDRPHARSADKLQCSL